MALASCAQTALALTAWRHPEVHQTEQPVTEQTVVRNAVAAGLFLVALVLGSLTPLSYFALFAQLLNGPVDRAIGRLTGRRRRMAVAAPRPAAQQHDTVR